MAEGNRTPSSRKGRRIMTKQNDAANRLYSAIEEAISRTYSGSSNSLQEMARFLIIERSEQVQDLKDALRDYTIELEIEERKRQARA